MTKDEALKLALEALNPWAGEDANHTEQYAAYHAIRESLASSVATDDTSQERVDETSKQRHEQEPIGYFQLDLRLDAWVQNRDSKRGVAFYTTPPHRKPLTDEQRDAIARQAAENDWHDYEVIDAVEAAHGIKE